MVFVIPLLGGIYFFHRQLFSFLGLILNQFTDYDTSVTKTGAVTSLILFVLFAIFSFLVPDETKMDDDTRGMRNFLLFSVAIQMFAPLHNLAMRMNYYYIIFIPLLIPKIIEARSERWGQVAITARHIMVIFFTVYFFYNAYTGTSNLRVFPYHFFWENV